MNLVILLVFILRATDRAEQSKRNGGRNMDVVNLLISYSILKY